MLGTVHYVNGDRNVVLVNVGNEYVLLWLARDADSSHFDSKDSGALRDTNREISEYVDPGDQLDGEIPNDGKYGILRNITKNRNIAIFVFATHLSENGAKMMAEAAGGG